MSLYALSRSMMKGDVKKLKKHVVSLALNPEFIHHDWFVDHHLSIVEQLVEELLLIHPGAAGDVCRAMVWVHDWGTIITNKGDHEQEATLQNIHATLPAFGYTPVQIQHIEHVYNEMETLRPLGEDFMIETRIASSADAMSHYIGPFAALYWRENATKSVPNLIQDALKKADSDMKRLLLPEVKKMAEPRIRALREFFPPNRPDRYFL